MLRGMAITLGTALLLGVLAAAVNLSGTETDLLAVAAVPVIVPIALGVSPLRLLRHR
jgi:hypothetical protein